MKQEKPPRILVIGDAVSPTGFARVIEGVFRPLADTYDVHQIGFNFYGDPHDWPWPIYPAGGRNVRQGIERIAPLVQKLRPDLVFMLHDPWVLAPALGVLRRFEGLPVVAYASFNAGPLDPKMLAELRGCERFVVYTEFARRAVEEGLARLDEPPAFPAIEVLPHGVDGETFHPLAADREAARRRARQELFPDHPALHDAFIVLNANRNQPRKRIDVTMEGFARFVEGKPYDVYLHLHMGKDDLGWDLDRLADHLGIGDRLIFTNPSRGIPSVSDAELNRIYNAADVGLNTTTSEGWGLISFEQGAVGLAQVVPDHTSGRELWQGAAELLEPSLTLWDRQLLCHEYLVDPTTVAIALDRLYNDSAHRQHLEAEALNRVRADRYRWSTISRQWDSIFRQTLGILPPLQTSTTESVLVAFVSG